MKPYAIGTEEVRENLRAFMEDARTLDKQDMYRRHGSVLAVLRMALQFLPEEIRADFETFVLEYREHFEELHNYTVVEGYVPGEVSYNANFGQRFNDTYEQEALLRAHGIATVARVVTHHNKRCAFLPCEPYKHLHRIVSEDEPCIVNALCVPAGTSQEQVERILYADTDPP